MVDQHSLKSIEDLHRMKTEGIITEAEFEETKRSLLSSWQSGGSSPPIASPINNDFFAWMVLPLKRYAEFTGRSSRKEYWAFSLFYVALFLIAIFTGEDDDEVMGIFILGMLPLLVPTIAVSVRRLRDQDKSGWHYALSFVPIVGPIVFLIWMVTHGTVGENRYGADPVVS